MEFSWAEPFPEVHKVCTLFELTELCDPINFCYKSLPSYEQEGPQCGLVALAMCMKSCNKETVENLYEVAKLKGYTYNGEMFSATDMCDLAKENLPDTKIEIYNGDLNSDEVKEFLLSGGMILAPYDLGKDHAPCLKKGHKAHWAAISGGIQTADEFYVLARHGKARNVAVWKLRELAESNAQLSEFSPSRKLHQVQYKLPEGGLEGKFGLNSKAVLINLK